MPQSLLSQPVKVAPLATSLGLVERHLLLCSLPWHKWRGRWQEHQAWGGLNLPAGLSLPRRWLCSECQQWRCHIPAGWHGCLSCQTCTQWHWCLGYRPRLVHIRPGIQGDAPCCFSDTWASSTALYVRHWNWVNWPCTRQPRWWWVPSVAQTAAGLENKWLHGSILKVHCLLAVPGCLELVPVFQLA